MKHLPIPIAREIRTQQQRIDDYEWDNADRLSDVGVRKVLSGMRQELARLRDMQARGVETYVSW